MKRTATIAAALVLAASAASAQQVVRLGTEGAYPPYNFVNDQAELVGFEIDLGNEICARAGLSCEWVQNDWDSIIPNLVSGNYDAIMAGMSITPERAEVISFSENYTPPAVSAYVALSDDVDIENGIIAAQVSTQQADYLARTDATLIEFATPDETIAAVRNGEADAVFADKDYLLPFVQESGGELMILEELPLGGGIGAGLRQSDTELRETITGVIAEMKEDGSLNELIVQWFGADALVF